MPETPSRRRWPVVSALGLVMIFTWGSSYYLMAVLAEPIAADTGWGLRGITGALSAGLLIAGLASPLVGRAIAHHGGRPVLAIGCLLITAGLVVLALSPSPWVFWLGWGLMGLGMAAGLYDPAFATLGRLYGSEARSAITHLTLFGGFASTVCWPLSALMLDAWGWRGVAWAYAAIHLAITLPLILRGIPRVPPRPAQNHPHPPSTSSEAKRNTRITLLLSGILVVHGLAIVTLATWLFTFLQAGGLDLATAVALGALFGPAQVGARLVETAAGGRHHPIWTLVTAMGCMALGLLLLALNLGLPGLALIFLGAGNGLFSIAKGAVPLAVFGAEHYPTVMGRLARPGLIAQAAAPILGAWLIDIAGVTGTLHALALLGAINLVAVAMLWSALRVPGGFGAK